MIIGKHKKELEKLQKENRILKEDISYFKEKQEKLEEKHQADLSEIFYIWNLSVDNQENARITAQKTLAELAKKYPDKLNKHLDFYSHHNKAASEYFFYSKCCYYGGCEYAPLYFKDPLSFLKTLYFLKLK